MKTIILAGGRGKRLKSITNYVPKSLIPLNNIPIIELQIKYLKKFGIKEYIICTGYLSKQIENYINEKNNFGVEITFSIEKKPLGTGGAIRKAVMNCNEKTYLVINGDIITNIDVSLLTIQVNSIAAIPLKTRYGIIEIIGSQIIGFNEKKEIKDKWMNAGIYYISKELIKNLPKNGDIERTVFPKYSKKKQITAIKYQNVFWYSIDTYKDIEECSNEIKSNILDIS